MFIQWFFSFRITICSWATHQKKKLLYIYMRQHFFKSVIGTKKKIPFFRKKTKKFKKKVEKKLFSLKNSPFWWNRKDTGLLTLKKAVFFEWFFWYSMIIFRSFLHDIKLFIDLNFGEKTNKICQKSVDSHFLRVLKVD